MVHIFETKKYDFLQKEPIIETHTISVPILQCYGTLKISTFKEEGSH